MNWEVGDGASIRFYKDLWVSTCPLRLWPNAQLLDNINRDACVQSFISSGRTWDWARHNEALGPEVTRIICRVPILSLIHI